MSAPPPGRFSAPDAAAVRFDDALTDRKPQPGSAHVAWALQHSQNLSKTRRSRSSGGMPSPSVSDGYFQVCALHPTADFPIGGSPAGEYFSALSMILKVMRSLYEHVKSIGTRGSSSVEVYTHRVIVQAGSKLLQGRADRRAFYITRFIMDPTQLPRVISSKLPYQPAEPVGFLSASLDQPAPGLLRPSLGLPPAAEAAGDRDQRGA